MFPAGNGTEFRAWVSNFGSVPGRDSGAASCLAASHSAAGPVALLSTFSRSGVRAAPGLAAIQVCRDGRCYLVVAVSLLSGQSS